VVRDTLRNEKEKRHKAGVDSQAEMDGGAEEKTRREAQDVPLEEMPQEALIDNLEKAISHSRDEGSLDALREGVELTLKGLRDTLDRAGLKEVKAMGEVFDPNFHEAVCQLEDACAKSGTVLQEFQKGYLLNQRLIRPAMVAVSKNAKEDESRRMEQPE
jgi:molecular chaperone GrpE